MACTEHSILLIASGSPFLANRSPFLRIASYERVLTLDGCNNTWSRLQSGMATVRLNASTAMVFRAGPVSGHDGCEWSVQQQEPERTTTANCSAMFCRAKDGGRGKCSCLTKSPGVRSENPDLTTGRDDVVSPGCEIHIPEFRALTGVEGSES